MKLESCRYIACLILMAMASGCRTQSPTASQPHLISPEAYDSVFDAAVHVIREHRFVVDRQDRRFGLIASKPRSVPTVAEPFQPDGAAAGLAFESTLNHQRRIVHVYLRPPGTETGQTPTEVPAEYELNVVVFLERKARPNVPLTSAALARPSLLRGDKLDRRIVTEQGLSEARWVAVDRDTAFEQQIASAIVQRTLAQ